MRQRKGFQMAIAPVGASPPAHVVAPAPTPPPAQPNKAPDKTHKTDDQAASPPPPQAATAPGTGQKVNVIA
jgi:hypothetical protein